MHKQRGDKWHLAHPVDDESHILMHTRALCGRVVKTKMIVQNKADITCAQCIKQLSKIAQ